MHKKAQVTVFIIIGMILLLIVGTTIYFTTYKAEEDLQIDLPDEIASVHNFIQQCLHDVTAPGAYLLASQGGFIFLPEEYTQGDFGAVPYAYTFGENTLISKASMANQLSEYINTAFPACLNNFESFSIPITASEPSAIVIIKPNQIEVALQYNVQVKDTTLDQFSTTVDAPLGTMHDIANEIVEKHVEDPNWIDLSAFTEYPYNIETIPYNRETLIYAVQDGDFIFAFGMRFAINDPPILLIEDSYMLQENVMFSMYVPYGDTDAVTFSDDSALFDISSEGLIEFTPEIPGVFEVSITATDSIGNTDEKLVTFVVQ